MIKRIFIFAHKGEAQTFIKNLKMKNVDNLPLIGNTGNFYQNKTDILFISGEGIQKVILNLTHILSIFKEIKEVYNFGIAGILNSKKYSAINQIYPIKICYGYCGESFFYQSFITNNSEKKVLSCVSTDKRVKEQKSIEKLSIIADIVDRELWGIGYVSSFFKKKIYSYKLLSDIPKQKVKCSQIISQAKKMSDELFFYAQKNFFLEERKNQKKKVKVNENLSIQQSIDILEQYFYCSYYQKKQLYSLLNLISINGKTCWKKKDILSFIELLNLKKEKEKKLDKKKFSLFLKLITKKTKPYEEKINKELEKLSSKFKNNDIQIKKEKNFQSNNIEFTFKSSDAEQYKKKVAIMNEIDVKDIYNLLNAYKN